MQIECRNIEVDFFCTSNCSGYPVSGKMPCAEGGVVAESAVPVQLQISFATAPAGAPLMENFLIKKRDLNGPFFL